MPTKPDHLSLKAKIPYENLPQCPRLLMINVLDRAAELNVHVTIDADQAAFVLCLAPFETDDDFFVDSVMIYSSVGDKVGCEGGIGF
jgi:hypothetical protein